MNAKRQLAIAALVALACASGNAVAQEPPVLDGVQVVYYLVDCEHRRLPSQQQVGAWTGQSNFSQVYATRQRLMGEIAQACQRPGIEGVELVATPGRRAARQVAVVATRR